VRSLVNIIRTGNTSLVRFMHLHASCCDDRYETANRVWYCWQEASVWPYRSWSPINQTTPSHQKPRTTGRPNNGAETSSLRPSLMTCLFYRCQLATEAENALF
jgi:hypothetical protein